MKKILFFAVMLLLPIATNAQLAIKAGLSGNVALSDMTDYWVGGPGVDLNIKYIIANHFGIGISSGFQHFFSNDDWDDESHDYDDENLNIVPLRLSFTYYLGTRRFKPYIGAELGVNYVKIDFSEKYSYYDPYYGTLWSSETNSDDNVRFGAAPVVGFHIDFGDSMVGLDIDTKLNYISDTDDYASRQKALYLNLNLGLVFRLWKP